MRETESTDSAYSIETERLVLRPLVPGNAEAIAALAPPVATAAQADIADARGWIARARLTPGAACFAIVEKASGAYIGAAGMAPMADQPSRPEIILWIAESHSRRGYATEAAQAGIDRVFADPSVEMIWGVCRVTNSRARRVMEKCGFQYRENGMARSVTLRGAVPVERFTLARRSWLSLKAWGAFAAREAEKNAKGVAA